MNSLTRVGSDATPLRDNPSVLAQLPFISQRVLRHLGCNLLDPGQELKLGIIMRDRRRARGSLTPPISWSSRQLREWISTPDSKVLRLQGSFLRTEQSKDLAIDLVELLRAMGLPVVWYLVDTATGELRCRSITPTVILRSLIKQTIDQHLDAANNWDLNEGHFAACKTEKDWLRLFVAVLAHVQKIVLVIDTQRTITGMMDMIAEFWREVNEQGIRTTVKILVLTYDNTSTALSVFPVLPTATKPAQPSPRSSSRHSRVRSRFGGGRRSGKRNESGEGPEDLKPFVLQLVNSSRDARDLTLP